MATKKKPFTRLRCSKCKEYNYFTNKTKGKNNETEVKLELSKFCNSCREHTIHKEAKK
jgi:large subunit ribosomal protein L33